MAKKLTATAKEGGWIVLAHYDDEGNITKMNTAKVGTKGVKAGVTYHLDAQGKFVEAK